jgi:hypothetical protein
MRFLLLILLCVMSSKVQAFSKTGHQMVCEMAYQLISANTKMQLDEAIKASPYSTFDLGCSWADVVRDEAEYQWSIPLHYINFPRSRVNPALEDCPEQGCILSGISAMQERLSRNKNDWQALLFLAHFIGDLHQPLHVSFTDDLGGNRTAVYFLGMPTNLHSVWDFALLKQAGYEQDDLQRLHRLFTAIESGQKTSWHQGTTLDWAKESAAITIGQYQQYKPGMLLDESYVSKNIPVAEKRVQQAAVRLAMLLDQLFNGK